MNQLITQWALRHGVSHQALTELSDMMTSPITNPKGIVAGMSEGAVVNNMMLEASRHGARLFRNNVGAAQDKNGRLIRYGLANTSKQMNQKLKSSDLIGIKPILITPAHVGCTIGQFVARECKEGNWSYKSTDHEIAQLTFLELIIALGGDACFANGEGTF